VTLIHPGVLPKFASDLGWIDAGSLPPRAFVTGAMRGPVMHAAERDRELIADLAAERTRLGESEVVGVR
jgi:hypothetical protein